jgi:hypothetical protein
LNTALHRQVIHPRLHTGAQNAAAADRFLCEEEGILAVFRLNAPPRPPQLMEGSCSIIKTKA